MSDPSKRNPRIISMIIFGLIWAALVSVPFVQTAVRFHYFKLTRYELDWLLLFGPGFVPALFAGFILGPVFARFLFLRSIRWQLLVAAIWIVLAPIYVFLLLFRLEIRQLLNHELSLGHLAKVFANGYPAFAVLSAIFVLPVTLLASFLAVILIRRSSVGSPVSTSNP